MNEETNTGNKNTGNRNSGDWNSGNCNSGYMNINEPKVRIFGKETDIKRDDLVFPDYWFFMLTEWISEEDMTDNEKKAFPSYKTTGGYLKVWEYKEAWQNAWDNATEEDKKKTFEVPNFDKDIFYQITGIKVDENSKKQDLLSKADELIEKANELKEQANNL